MSDSDIGHVIALQCVQCGKEHRPDPGLYTCSSCQGNLDILYDYDAIGSRLSREGLMADPDRSIWHYRALLPIAGISLVPPLFVGWTPIYSLLKLASEYGVKELLIKDDGRNPTASFKDRPSALAVVKALEVGAQAITTASSGNAGAALAGMCAAVGLKSFIFVPATAPEAKVAQLLIYGAHVLLVEGSYDEAYELCLEASRRFGWYQRNTGYNPYMTEGKKTAALEICEQLQWQAPGKVIVSMGDGCIIGGLWKGFLDFHRLGFIDRLPQMIGVQAEGAAPLVAALSSGELKQTSATTIADSICVGKPRDAVKALRAMHDSGGLGLTVKDEEILHALSKLARDTGIFAEPAAAAAYAGFLKLAESGGLESDERLLVMITGNGLKDIPAARRVAREPMSTKPELGGLENLLRQNALIA
ncbi:MAG: threonine synthase [Acidobacteria bacterium]|nr:threonine synthase [Acidobacteriota bacterium]